MNDSIDRSSHAPHAVAGRPRVTVVMPVYNAERFLKEAIDSILGQTYEDFELLAIDDGSTDASAAIIEEYADHRIRLVRCERNGGVVSARNLGVRLAEGRYLAMMDADDVSLPERLKRQVDWLNTHPETAVVATRAVRIDVNGHPIESMVSVTRSDDVHMYLRSGINPIINGSTMMRTEFVRALDGYREGFSPSEDYDLWLRLVDRGRICILADELYRYRSNPHGLRLSRVFGTVLPARHALDCYRRRSRGLPELTVDEFRSTQDMTALEVSALWAALLELLLTGTDPASLEQLLNEILRRDQSHRPARALSLAIRHGLAQRLSLWYRKYRLYRGAVAGSWMGSQASRLKHSRAIRAAG